MTQYTLINEETGELINITEKLDFAYNSNLSKQVINQMLKDNSIDKSILFYWLKRTGELNLYNQVKIKSAYFSKDLLKITREHTLFAGYMLKMFSFMDNYTNMIKKNQQTFINSFEELFKLVELTNEKQKTKFKKFLINNNVVKKAKTSDWRIIVNPFMFRNSTHIGQFALCIFKDCFEKDKNISKYSIKWLEINGY